MSPRPRLLRHPSDLTGFSLIEVTIALGILAFTAVVILGLLPTGLASSQRSSHVMVAARLAAEVQSELQQVGFSSFPTNKTSFAVDGRIVIDASGHTLGTTPPIYDVYRTVLDGSLPGTNSSVLKRVVVQVVKNPSQQTLSRDPSSGLVTVPVGFEDRTFQFHVVAP